MEFLTSPGTIDQTNTMYPSILQKLEGSSKVIKLEPHSTVYGVVLSGKCHIGEKYVVEQEEYFSFATNMFQNQQLVLDGELALFTRVGFNGQFIIGGKIESSGRLSYIDNCSDTILVYPPRYGDPSISLLSFPKNITQRFHIHPSIRLGVIIRGQGEAETPDGKYSLTPGTCFCVHEREIHRFVTTTSGLDAVSYHPDGDWGPTDQNHTLLNRTYTGIFMS
jgi:hypothetical protein